MLWRMNSAELLTLLGVRIRTLRKAKGVTQERLSELANINLSYMSEIERGQANVSLAIVNEISNALGIPISELFGDLNEKELRTGSIIDLLREARDLSTEQQIVFVEAVKGLLTGLKKV